MLTYEIEQAAPRPAHRKLQRAARHLRVPVKVFDAAVARKGRVQPQRGQHQQHIDDPHPEIFAAQPREADGMGLNDETLHRRWLDRSASLWKPVKPEALRLHSS